MGAVQAVDYTKELEEEQAVIRKRILESMEDIKSGKGKEYTVFFSELEKKYAHV